MLILVPSLNLFYQVITRLMLRAYPLLSTSLVPLNTSLRPAIKVIAKSNTLNSGL